ncbi:hypothetical protein B0H14DRAFT_2608131 [Mycena olivaceomarginata]|nr:hypothetical protein B0H14DRAFT_2608131 [Mycena olivaceomarginata]
MYALANDPTAMPPLSHGSDSRPVPSYTDFWTALNKADPSSASNTAPFDPSANPQYIPQPQIRSMEYEKPEVKTLLLHYNETQLHSRRPGRSFGAERNVDNFTAGISKLGAGTLTQWARKTTRDRGIHVEAAGNFDYNDSDSEDEDGYDEDEIPEMTLGFIHSFEGELVIDIEEQEQWGT